MLSDSDAAALTASLGVPDAVVLGLLTLLSVVAYRSLLTPRTQILKATKEERRRLASSLRLARWVAIALALAAVALAVIGLSPLVQLSAELVKAHALTTIKWVLVFVLLVFIAIAVGAVVLAFRAFSRYNTVKGMY